ncbi:MAG: GNAT family N-acetyltransferase [Bacteroidales bacterium]|nr:GNAT family N-acetyltransferase [Bacteroidales bacterium]MDD4236397.1 GNAT family N-acetyltransferase [Bacteroidales bacterium]
MKKNIENIKLIKFDYVESKLFEDALKIRTEVFVEEHNVPSELEYDGKDPLATHFLLLIKEKPIATARILQKDEGIKLERFAVIKDYRGAGLGRLLMEFITKHCNAEDIFFHSQDGAVEFYKQMGYCIIGEAFYEAGIKHYLMKHKSKIN